VAPLTTGSVECRCCIIIHRSRGQG
jgi:hypothetical protein